MLQYKEDNNANLSLIKVLKEQIRSLESENKALKEFKEILDKMGELSAKAQSLPTRVTSTSKFFPSDQVLILKANKNRVFGYLE